VVRKLLLEFKSRNRRILGEVTRMQTEMAQQNPKPAPSIFRNRPDKLSDVIIFSFLLVLIATGCWFAIRHFR
jgi:hypothetical protein